MIKTKDGATRINGTMQDIVMDFVGTAEALMKGTPLTVKEMHAAIDLAKLAMKIGESDEEFNTKYQAEDYEPSEEEDEEEDEPAEPAQAEEKKPEKGKLRVGKFEADDIEGMLEWLKGKLENLEDESDD